MKKLLLKTTFIFALTLAAVSLKAQTSGALTFTFTEIAKTPTYNGNSQHVLAVWIQTNTGAFVKTKLRYVGGGTNDHLPTWGAQASCQNPTAVTVGTCNTVDGLTGATRAAWTTYTVLGMEKREQPLLEHFSQMVFIELLLNLHGITEQLELL